MTVLAYHLVDGGTDSPVDIPMAQFIEELDWLQAHTRVVPLMDADPWGPGDQVVLTFDDAYANFAEVVWPVLRDRGLPATLYIPTAFVDGAAPPITGTSLPACSWDELAEMVGEGLDPGSHTVSHPDLRTVRDGMWLAREIGESRSIIEERTGGACRSFCYPRALFSRAADLAVQSVYERAVVGGGRRWTAGIEAHRIPRTSIRRDSSSGS